MAEWSKALVLGTSHFDGVGSNPTAANTIFFSPFFYALSFEFSRLIKFGALLTFDLFFRLLTFLGDSGLRV